MTELELLESADEVAEEVVDAFSMLHPSILMNWHQWSDLREMIQREVRGAFGDHPMSARDLLKKD